MAICAVTGANGFIGSQVVREALRRGHEVIALVGADLDAENLRALPVEIRPLEVLDPLSVRRGLAGAEWVAHAAACYTFWRRDPVSIYRVNVEGTRNVLGAAREQGVARVVVTSSTATLSPGFVAEPDPWRLGDEEDVFDLRRFRGDYKMSKVMAEMVALREAARGLPLVVVHPTTVLGAGDRRPTPSGSLIVHYLNGHMRVYVPMMQNLVDVADVAAGHLLALEQGRVGERYVLGGENLSMAEIVAILEELTGIPAPRVAIPHPVIAVAGRVDQWLARLLGREPWITREAALHARDSRGFDIAKARKELGYEPRPARAVLASAVRWFASHGFCPDPPAARVLAELGDDPAD